MINKFTARAGEVAKACAVFFVLLAGSMTGSAAVTLYGITMQATYVVGNPFGTTIAIGDTLTATVGFDPTDLTGNPFRSFTATVNLNTHELVVNPLTTFQQLSSTWYFLRYSGTASNQWRINDTLVTATGGA